MRPHGRVPKEACEKLPLSQFPSSFPGAATKPIPVPTGPWPLACDVALLSLLSPAVGQSSSENLGPVCKREQEGWGLGCIVLRGSSLGEMHSADWRTNRAGRGRLEELGVWQRCWEEASGFWGTLTRQKGARQP